jgi:hypothetical protein
MNTSLMKEEWKLRFLTTVDQSLALQVMKEGNMDGQMDIVLVTVATQFINMPHPFYEVADVQHNLSSLYIC